MSWVRRVATVIGISIATFCVGWMMASDAVRQDLVARALAQTGCVPNPNLQGPPLLVNGCTIPATVLNALTVVPGLSPSGGDDSATFSARVSNICAASGGVLTILPGTWRAHDINIPCALTIRGSGRAATVIDYSAAASYGFRWQVPNYPAFKSTALMEGGGIEDLSFTRSSGNTAAIIVQGVRDWKAQHLIFNTSYIGISGTGVQNVLAHDISMYGTISQDFVFTGDLTGEQASGAACAVANADCSTQSCCIVFDNIFLIDNTATNTCYTFTGFIATISSGGPMACEGPNIGMQVSCPPGLDPQLSQCPHFIFPDNFQVEFFKTAGLVFQDTVSVRMDKVYSYANNVGTAANALSISSVNYGASAGCGGGQCFPPGDMHFSNSLFFGTQNDPVLIQAAASSLVTDISITHSDIYGGNISNGGFGAISVAPSGGSVTQGHFDGNSLCNVSGFGGANASAYGIKYGSGATNFNSNGNTYFSCAVPIINGSFTNVDSNPNPRPSFGTVTEVDGHNGSSGTIAGANGNANYGTIRIHAAGSGISSSGGVTLSLPANVTMQPGMHCTLQPAGPNWGNGANIIGTSSNTTTELFNWYNIVNGTLTNLTSGNDYDITYTCLSL